MSRRAAVFAYSVMAAETGRALTLVPGGKAAPGRLTVLGEPPNSELTLPP
jgi:hypothetical protein